MTTVTTTDAHGFANGDLVCVTECVGEVTSPTGLLETRSHKVVVTSPTTFELYDSDDTPLSVTHEGLGGAAYALYDYNDGDSSGWAWDGDAHNSPSRQA